ncbi:hypothetical protein QL285_014095 [Trifolium repens]|nr:hypothetical protein QL285_014095 [Trifolium repens]
MLATHCFQHSSWSSSLFILHHHTTKSVPRSKSVFPSIGSLKSRLERMLRVGKRIEVRSLEEVYFEDEVRADDMADDYSCLVEWQAIQV